MGREDEESIWRSHVKYYTLDNQNQLNIVNEFTVQRFIDDYEDSYYLHGDQEKADTRSYVRVSVNSRIAEERIDQILKNRIRTQNDVDIVIAWKVGGIDHENSQKNNRIEYIPSWNNQETNKVECGTFRCDRENYCTFCNEIVKVASAFRKQSSNGIVEDRAIKNALSGIVTAMNRTSVTGFGCVYLLTILYFVTGGYSPIFDRCAYKAVRAIYHEKKPEEIWYEQPSCKSVNYILKVVHDYKWYLEQLFGTSHIDREIDRALWVYGHSSLTEMGQI